MSFMVVFQGTDGNSVYHQSESLEDATLFVERLRNDQDVESARMYRMDEVHFEMRTYYKVEVKGAPAVDASAPAVDTPKPVASAVPAPEPEVAVASVPEPEIELPASTEPVEALVPDNGSTPVIESFGGSDPQPQRRGLFGR